MCLVFLQISTWLLCGDTCCNEHSVSGSSLTPPRAAANVVNVANEVSAINAVMVLVVILLMH